MSYVTAGYAITVATLSLYALYVIRKGRRA